MKETFSLILGEISDLRRAQESARGMLYRIDAFMIAGVSGLLIGTQVYNMNILNLFAPVIVYLIGYMWSSESIRLVKIRRHIAELEAFARELIKEDNPKLPEGYEMVTRGRKGFLFLLRYENIMVASAALYGAFWFLFMYLLAISNYPVALRACLLILYSVLAVVFWIYDAWNNRHYLFPGTKL